MRGDRPGCVLPGEVSPWATPHARGSTFLARVAWCTCRGYPACAGIDHTIHQKQKKEVIAEVLLIIAILLLPILIIIHAATKK